MAKLLQKYFAEVTADAYFYGYRHRAPPTRTGSKLAASKYGKIEQMVGFESQDYPPAQMHHHAQQVCLPNGWSCLYL